MPKTPSAVKTPPYEVHFAEPPLLINYRAVPPVSTVENVPAMYPELDPQDRDASVMTEDIHPSTLLPES